MKWRAQLAGCGVVLGALSVLNGCQWFPDREAVRVLQDIAAGEGPSRLKAETPAPVRVSVQYEQEGRRYVGDLYEPVEEPLAGIVLVPGVAQAGKDDPRLVVFAQTLARARFRVLVPDLPSIRALKVQAEDVVGVTDAFVHLVWGVEWKSDRAAGIGAFSYAAGPAVLAAMEPRIRGRVDFVLAVGGYYDLEQVLTFSTTGCFKEGDEWRQLRPIRYGKWMFVRSNLARIQNPADRQTLEEIVERRMNYPYASVDELAGRLGEEGRTVYALVTNRDPERVSALIASLPPPIREELAALNLAGRDLSPLQARLILVHGREDAIIPYTESVALASAVPDGQARLYVVEGLSHVDVRPAKLDRRRLVQAVQALLEQRRAR